MNKEKFTTSELRDIPAELESLRAQLKEAQEAAEFNFQQYQDAGRLLCEAQAEIEKLKAYYAQVFKDGERQIQIHKENAAASQANEVQLREALSQGCGWAPIGSTSKSIMYMALALPPDTTALAAMIAKASEVMRERCAEEAQTEMDEQYIDSDPWYAARSCREAIRALPGVTMEDLK